MSFFIVFLTTFSPYFPLRLLYRYLWSPVLLQLTTPYDATFYMYKYWWFGSQSGETLTNHDAPLLHAVKIDCWLGLQWEGGRTLTNLGDGLPSSASLFLQLVDSLHHAERLCPAPAGPEQSPSRKTRAIDGGGLSCVITTKRTLNSKLRERIADCQTFTQETTKNIESGQTIQPTEASACALTGMQVSSTHVRMLLTTGKYKRTYEPSESTTGKQVNNHCSALLLLLHGVVPRLRSRCLLGYLPLPEVGHHPRFVLKP